MRKAVKEILDEIGSSASRIHKEETIEKYKNDINFTDVLRAALDPYKQYYMFKIPEYTKRKSPDMFIDEALILINQLTTRKVTGNNAIKFVQDILSGLPEDDAEVVKRIIKKDLRVGVSVKTVNKVIPKFIPEYPCMLTASYSKKNLERINYPAYGQEKMDGMRVNIIIENNKISYRSRNGKLIELHNIPDVEFQKLSRFSKDGVFDGEMLVERDGKILDRKTGNGILNKAVRKTITPEDASLVRFVLWDFIPLKDFKNNRCDLPYSKRFTMLSNLLDNVESNIISRVETRQINNQQEANDTFNEFLAKGSEGIILKNADGPWENKRATHQVKMKAELDADLKVVSWMEGGGKYAGKLGALICESSDGKLKVSVGSGFNDEQRDTLKPEDVVGKIITVKYNERINSKNKDEDSLFLPIFLEFREDKDIANKSSEIK